MAAASLEAGHPADAVRALAPIVDRYPDHAPSLAVLARAYRETGDRERAESTARAALRLNPFDPSPHCDLAAVATDDATRALEARQCTALGGSIP